MPTSSRGLFRTPLACALLTGAIGGGAAVIAFEKGPNPYVSALGMAVSLGCDFVMCCGPALCRRDLKLLIHAAGWAAAMGMVDLFLPAVCQLHETFYLAVVVPHWPLFFCGASLLLGVVTGLATAAMYNQPLIYGKCVVYGILAQAPAVVFTIIVMTIPPPEDAVGGFLTMLFILSYIAAVAIPAIPIDAAWRKGEIVDNLPKGPVKELV